MNTTLMLCGCLPPSPEDTDLLPAGREAAVENPILHPHPPPSSRLALPMLRPLIVPGGVRKAGHFLSGHFLHTLRNVLSYSLYNLSSPRFLIMTASYF